MRVPRLDECKLVVIQNNGTIIAGRKPERGRQNRNQFRCASTPEASKSEAPPPPTAASVFGLIWYSNKVIYVAIEIAAIVIYRESPQCGVFFKPYVSFCFI